MGTPEAERAAATATGAQAGSGAGVRILWVGDMSATGFGTVTEDLGRALLARGADVRFLSQNDLRGELPEPFASRTVEMAFLTVTGSETVEGGRLGRPVTDVAEWMPRLVKGEAPETPLHSGAAWGDWRPDFAVLLGDFAAVRLFAAPHIRAFTQLPTLHYVPVEGVDLPPLWAELWRLVAPVAMSRFGADQIERILGRRPPVIYHGVDTGTFRPATPAQPIVLTDTSTGTISALRTKEDCKRFFGADPHEQWMLRTDRHMPRKNYNAMLRALGPVLAERERARLIIHVARLWDQGGFLPDSVSKMPAVAQARTRFTMLGAIPRPVLAALYNAADVYVSSGAEGFGLTIAEAIACGTPAVGLNYSAVPEVIGPAGAVVPVGTLTDNEYDHFWARPDEAELGQAAAWMLDHPMRARGLGSLGPAWVRRQFSWEAAAARFLDLMGAG